MNKSLKQGIKIESEHKGTYKKLKEGKIKTSKDLYKSIASDHIKERKDYYKRLKKCGL